MNLSELITYVPKYKSEWFGEQRCVYYKLKQNLIVIISYTFFN